MRRAISVGRAPFVLIAAAFIVGGCEPVGHVVLTIEDPAGVADAAVSVGIGTDPEALADETMGGGRFPITATLSGTPDTTRTVWVEARDDNGVALGSGSVLVRFRQAEVGARTVALRPACTADADCDDGLFCTGQERCVDRGCEPPEPACPDSLQACVTITCSEDNDACVVDVDHEVCPADTFCDPVAGCASGERCQTDEECQDGFECNGAEQCEGYHCVPGTPPSAQDNNDCTLDACAEGVGVINEPVPDGNACTLDSGEPGVCVLGTCAPTGCGDGIVDLAGGEQCDDGDDDNSDECLDSCLFNVCGDGAHNPATEQCDDGNDRDDDGCVAGCRIAFCGDGHVQGGVEQCDDGNTNPYDNCLPGCISNNCGDGVLNPLQEECDDGNTTSFDGCSAQCSNVIWTVDLGEPVSDIAPTHWTWTDSVPAPDQGDAGPSDGGAGSPDGGVTLVEVERPTVGVALPSGRVVALDALSGAVRWEHEVGGAVTATISAGRVAVIVPRDDGTIFSIPLAGPEVDPGVQSVALPRATQGAGVAVGTGAPGWTTLERYIAVDIEGEVYDLTSNGGFGDFNAMPFDNQPYAHTTRARDIEPAASCDRCTPTGSNGQNTSGWKTQGVAVPLGETIFLWNFRGNCAPQTFALQAGEEVSGQVVFATDNSLNWTLSDRAFVATTAGRLLAFRTEIGSDLCQVPAALWSKEPGQTFVGSPIALPIFGLGGGWSLQYGTVEGTLHKTTTAGNPVGTPWPYDLGAPVAATPSADADYTLYVGGEDGRIHAVLPNAQALWIRQLASPLAGGVLVEEGAVYALTRDGHLTALEGGGRAYGDLFGWHRQGGNSGSRSIQSDCDAAATHPWWGGLLVCTLLMRRRWRTRQRS